MAERKGSYRWTFRVSVSKLKEKCRLDNRPLSNNSFFFKICYLSFYSLYLIVCSISRLYPIVPRNINSFKVKLKFCPRYLRIIYDITQSLSVTFLQFATIIFVYREWLINADNTNLRSPIDIRNEIIRSKSLSHCSQNFFRNIISYVNVSMIFVGKFLKTYILNLRILILLLIFLSIKFREQIPDSIGREQSQYHEKKNNYSKHPSFTISNLVYFIPNISFSSLKYYPAQFPP